MDEHAVQNQISDWLRNVASADVYWAENPPGQFESFQFEGVEDRPDLLAIADLTIIVELKDGDDSAGIYDAMAQLHEYWRLHEFEDATVTVNQQPVTPDAFAIATQYSPEGHLFKLEREQGFRQTYEAHEAGWNRTMRPQYEYARTEAIPRIQWRYAWYEAETRQGESRQDIDAGLGVLLSKRLDDNPGQSSFDEFGDSPDATGVAKILMYRGDGNATWTPI